MTTSLAADEIIAEAAPAVPPETDALSKSFRRHGDFAIAAIAAAILRWPALRQGPHRDAGISSHSHDCARPRKS
jgi:hypothetical protein